jgi:hypothetical protein
MADFDLRPGDFIPKRRLTATIADEHRNTSITIQHRINDCRLTRLENRW